MAITPQPSPPLTFEEEDGLTATLLGVALDGGVQPPGDPRELVPHAPREAGTQLPPGVGPDLLPLQRPTG